MTERALANINTSHQYIAWFSDQTELGRLNLRPSFQRRPVWSREQKAFLIDSILRGYPVPEIYMYSTSNSGKSIEYFVVDGQQRLRACLEFMADSFPISFDIHKLEPLHGPADTPWFNKRFSQLDPSERDRFNRYKLIVRDLEDADIEEIRHMFHRLNQSNVALNTQELRYSMYEGGILTLVERLVKRDEWEQFRLFTPNQRRRMLDSEFVSELILGYLHWPQNKKDNLDHYYRLYGQDFPFGDDVEGRFDVVLNFLTQVFPRPRMNGTRWFRKSDFYTLFLAIARGRIDIESWESAELCDKLTTFSALVSAKPPEDDTPPGLYRAAVERAATDRARRIRREVALIAFLEGRPIVSVDDDIPRIYEDEGEMLESDLDPTLDSEDEEYEDAEIPLSS